MRLKQDRFFISIKWLLLNTLTLAPFFGMAQLQQYGRLEIPISNNNERFEVSSGKEYGLVLHRRMTSRSGDFIELIHTDSSLQELWHGELPVDKNLVIGNQIIVEDNLYLILHDVRLADRNFQLYRVNLHTRDYIKFSVRNSIPFFPTMLEVNTQGALIGGYYNRVPLVLFFQFDIQKSKILPGLFNETGELAQLKVNPDASFDLLICAQNYQKQKTIWLKHYDAFGKLEDNIMLIPDDDNHLIFGRLIQTNDNARIVAGVFGNKNGEYSKGLFIATLDEVGVRQIKYYNFGELDNFFNYMRDKQEYRIKRKIERKRIRGKKLRFQYRFLVHELLPSGNQFIMLGEAFYKRYKNPPVSPLMASAYNTERIFDGYQYTHAAVLGIDFQGNLIWDNSFEMNDVRTFSLEQYVKMDIQDDSIVLLYLSDNKLQTKIIRDNNVLEGKDFNELDAKSSEAGSDESQTITTKLDYWYKGYFLTHGIQNTVSPPSQGGRRRKVYFITKVGYPKVRS